MALVIIYKRLKSDNYLENNFYHLYAQHCWHMKIFGRRKPKFGGLSFLHFFLIFQSRVNETLSALLLSVYYLFIISFIVTQTTLGVSSI